MVFSITTMTNPGKIEVPPSVAKLVNWRARCAAMGFPLGGRRKICINEALNYQKEIAVVFNQKKGEKRLMIATMPIGENLHTSRFPIPGHYLDIYAEKEDGIWHKKISKIESLKLQ